MTATRATEATPVTRATIAVRRAPVVVARRLDLRLLAPVAVGWPVVAFWSLLVDVRWSVLMAVLAAVASVGLLHPWRRSRRSRRARRSDRARLLALVLAGMAVLLVAAAGHRSLRAAGPLDELAQQRAVVTLRGTLVADPRVIGGGAPGAEGAPPLVVVEVAATEVVGRGRKTPVAAPVLVIAGPQWAALGWRDRVEVVVRLSPPDAGDRVVAVATPKGEARVLARAGGLFAVADVVRGRFRDATAGLPPDAAGLVPALVIGDTTRSPPDLTADMLETGMSHLSAVSGSNVTLVLVAAVGLCRLLAVRRRWRPWLAGGALVCFVVLARPEPSVIRAAVMGGIGLLALSASRRQVGVPALAGAVVALLVWDPWLSRSYGFALSAVATLGLLLFVQPWGRAIGRVLPPRLRGLGPVLAVPLAAQAVCAPLVVPLQGSVSLIAVVANLLAAPLVAPTTILGVAVALLSVLWVGGAAVLAWGAGVPALGIAAVARLCADVPMGSLDWGDSAWAAVGLAAITAGVVLAGPWLWRRARLQPLVVVAVVLVGSVFTVPTAPLTWPPPGWVVAACDVGQGDGLVVNNGGGHAVVVDAGPQPELIDACLDRLGVTVVDLVVLTHFHADHVRGLEGVFDGRAVSQLRVSPVREPVPEAERVEALAGAARVPVHELRAGDDLEVGAVRARVWWPARPLSAGSVANNGSVVMTLHVGGVGVLFSGDIEREAAAEVARASARDPEPWAGIDVVKVAHHGSSNRDDRVLDAVAGRLALVSVGADNDYGHPAPATLKALSDRGFEVHRTDLEGDLAVVADALGVRVLAR